MKNLLKNNLIKNYFLLTIFLMLTEILFRIVSNIPLKSLALLRIFIGINFISILLSFILSWLNKKINKIILLILSFLINLYAFVQIGFNNFIGVYASFNTRSQLGAVTDYIKDFFSSFKITYYVLFIPFILFVLYYIFLDKLTENKINKKFLLKTNIVFEPGIRTITSILALTLCSFLYYESLDASFMQNKLQTVSTKDLFKYPSVPSITINQFGILGFGILDTKSLLNEAPVNYTYAINTSTNDNKETNESKKRTVDDTILDKII